MAEYLDACRVEGVGPFITMAPSRFTSEISGFTKRLILESTVRLPPYDANITQMPTRIESTQLRIKPYTTSLLIKLLSGSSDMWRKSVGTFVGELRNQLLLWRTLSGEEKAKYMKIGESIKKSFEGEENESRST